MAKNQYDGIEFGTIQWRHHHHYPGHFGVHGMQYQARHHMIKPLPTAPLSPPFMPRPGTRSNWATGGPGMQAVFLGPKKYCGTGVFLPRGLGADSRPHSKLVSPVLIPVRVVQALNINVHGFHNKLTKPKPVEEPKKIVEDDEEKLEEEEPKKIVEDDEEKLEEEEPKKIVEDDEEKLEEEEMDDRLCLAPGVFLPNEWPY